MGGRPGGSLRPWTMTKQAEALKLADELLADIELSRLSADKCLLKGTRLARLVLDEEAQACCNLNCMAMIQIVHYGIS